MSSQTFSPPSTQSMESLLPGFEFTDKISANGLGAVYFANQKSLDRRVAIKLLAPNPGIQAAFESKARASAGLKHPNIISIFDSGCVEEMPFLVMEFVPGKSLAHSTLGKMVDFAQVMVLMEGISEGLAYAHADGLVHGCFNSYNVLLNQKAEPKIGNFGLPISTREDASGDGASRFVAPEVLSRQKPATTRSDVYSLGVVLYELLTGRSHGTDVPPPSEICRCNPQIDAIWRQATDPDPAKRMADARAFLAALKDAPAKPKSQLSTASVAAKAPADSASAKQQMPPPKVGVNWKLMRNLVIIAVLLYGIHFMWGHLETARVRRDKENREILARHAAEKEKALTEAKRKQADQASPKPRSGGLSETSETTKEKETSEESLSRLRSRLASGSRTEMPIGSVRKGECDYLFVSDQMSLAEAAWFAESHGGHLAIPDAEADEAWLAAEIASGKAAWLATSKNDGKSLPFIIQWHSDGSNPASLAAQLTATKRSLAGSNAVYPYGTIASGDRYHLLVMRPLTWEQAADLAKEGGGYLMVVSNSEEDATLKKMTAKLKADDGIWLGASLEGDLWGWTTGEVWESASWGKGADATEEGCALVMRPGDGWDGRNRNDQASGFIIEWSKDATKAATKAAPTDEAAELTKRAADLLTAAKQKHVEAIAANAKKFNWDLDAFLRGLKKSSQDEWGPEVRSLKDCVKDDRLQKEQMESGIRYTSEMQKFANYHLQKQTEIDTQLSDTAAKIRDAYMTKLGGIAKAAENAGQPKLAESIAGALESADNLDSWIESMTGQSPGEDDE